MKLSRMTLPALFFAITLFGEIAMNRPHNNIHPCSTVPFSPADTTYDDSKCGTGTVICCYLPNTSAIVAKIFS